MMFRCLSISAVLLACQPESVITAVGLSDEVATVVVVDVELEGGEHWLEYGVTQQLGLSTPNWTETGAHSIPLLGLPQATDVYIRLMRDNEGRVEEGPLSVVRTGTLPAWVPFVETTGELPDGFVLLSALGGPTTSILIVNQDGQVVWYRSLDEDVVVTDAQFAIAPPERDFEVLSLVSDQDYTVDISAILRFNSRGEMVASVDTPMAHHSFTQGPGEDLSWIAADVREIDGIGPVVGDQIVRFNGVEAIPVRSTWDLYGPPDAEELALYEDYLEIGEDWTHANHLVWDEDRGHYLLSLRNKHDVFALSKSGTVEMVVGDAHGWNFEPSTSVMHEQHAPVWAGEDTMLLLNQESRGTRVVELELDSESHTAEATWSYGLDDGAKMYVLGNVARIPSGETLVNWGSRGVVQWLDEGKSLQWTLESELGHFFASARWVADLYGRE